MKTTKKDFALFKKWFRHYQNKFQINDYRVDFMHEKVHGYAQISTRQLTKVARVSLDTNWGEYKITDEKIKSTALHECLHLLTSRIVWIAGHRFIGEDEIYEESERLAVKLTNIFENENTTTR